MVCHLISDSGFRWKEIFKQRKQHYGRSKIILKITQLSTSRMLMINVHVYSVNNNHPPLTHVKNNNKNHALNTSCWKEVGKASFENALFRWIMALSKNILVHIHHILRYACIYSFSNWSMSFQYKALPYYSARLYFVILSTLQTPPIQMDHQQPSECFLLPVFIFVVLVIVHRCLAFVRRCLAFLKRELGAQNSKICHQRTIQEGNNNQPSQSQHKTNKLPSYYSSMLHDKRLRCVCLINVILYLGRVVSMYLVISTPILHFCFGCIDLQLHFRSTTSLQFHDVCRLLRPCRSATKTRCKLCINESFWQLII